MQALNGVFAVRQAIIGARAGGKPLCVFLDDLVASRLPRAQLSDEGDGPRLYRLTGLSGLIKRATMCLSWSMLSTPLVPKRGIDEHGSVACAL